MARDGTTYDLGREGDNPYPKEPPKRLRGSSLVPGVDGSTGPWGDAYDLPPSEEVLKTQAKEAITLLQETLGLSPNASDDKILEQAEQDIEKGEYGKAVWRINTVQTHLNSVQQPLTKLMLTSGVTSPPSPLPIPPPPDRQSNARAPEVDAEHNAASRRAFRDGALKHSDATQR